MATCPKAQDTTVISIFTNCSWIVKVRNASHGSSLTGRKSSLHRIGGCKGSDGDHIRTKENSCGWERDSRSREHHAEEDHQVPVMLDQGIELSMAA